MLRIKLSKEEVSSKKPKVPTPGRVRLVAHKVVSRSAPKPKRPAAPREKKGQGPVMDQAPVITPDLLSSLNEQMAGLKRSRGKLSSSIFKKVYGHTEAPTIDIGSALAHFDNTVDEETSQVLEYDVMFLAINRSSGNVYVRQMRARKNVQSPKRQMRSRNPRGKQQYNLKYAGTMLLHDTKLTETRSVKVRMIFAFKLPEEKTWCRVADRSEKYSGDPGSTDQVYRQEELNNLYHEIDSFQPQIQEVFDKIRSLENTGRLPEEIRPQAADHLDALKVRRRQLNDLIHKTEKKLTAGGKRATADKIIEWQEKLALAKAERLEVINKINSYK